MSLAPFQDHFQRRFTYLRLSLTELCNFRCLYCLPNGCSRPAETSLSSGEIHHLVSALAELGIRKVRLTGGEPTLRKDLLEIIETVHSVPGIEQIALTTNGHGILPLLPKLKAVGLHSINFSLDSLDPSRFARITGQPFGAEVRQAIEAALDLGIPVVKANVVLLKGLNDHELPAYLEWARAQPLSIRFIELMQTSDNSEFFSRHHLSAEGLRQVLLEQGWRAELHAKELGQGISGPARIFTHPEFAGSIGLVTPYSKNFCESCNRLRVSASGNLRLCLFGETEVSLRAWLQTPGQKEELQTWIAEHVTRKGPSHRLLEGIYGSTQHLASIGG